MMRELDRNRQAIAKLCRKHGVRRLVLFGSAAAGEFDPARSDLDLLVEFEALSPLDHANAYFGLADDLEALVGRRVDLVEPQVIRNPYLKRSIEESQETLYVAS